jgi:multisubunit Na+/H+ antiporter MnhF subunit
MKIRKYCKSFCTIYSRVIALCTIFERVIALHTIFERVIALHAIFERVIALHTFFFKELLAFSHRKCHLKFVQATPLAL